jgi:hypothetical protein
MSSIFWDIKPYSRLKVKGRFGGTCPLHLRDRILSPACCLIMLVSCLAYSITLKMEANISSETSVDFDRTARRYILEERTLLWNSLSPSSASQFVRCCGKNATICDSIFPVRDCELRKFTEKWQLFSKISTFCKQHPFLWYKETIFCFLIVVTKQDVWPRTLMNLIYRGICSLLDQQTTAHVGLIWCTFHISTFLSSQSWPYLN